MEPLTILILFALLATLLAMALGLLSMSAGGETDRVVGTWLMWARVGFQGLAVLLLLVALLSG